jgi:hypothetical protein
LRTLGFEMAQADKKLKGHIRGESRTRSLIPFSIEGKGSHHEWKGYR